MCHSRIESVWHAFITAVNVVKPPVELFKEDLQFNTVKSMLWWCQSNTIIDADSNIKTFGERRSLVIYKLTKVFFPSSKQSNASF